MQNITALFSDYCEVYPAAFWQSLVKQRDMRATSRFMLKDIAGTRSMI
jgi:hypothetical protein